VTVAICLDLTTKYITHKDSGLEDDTVTIKMASYNYFDGRGRRVAFCKPIPVELQDL